MSVSKMEKLTAVVPQQQSEALLRRLMRLRAVSLIDPPDGTEQLSPMPPADITEITQRVARVDAVLPILAKYSRRPFRLFPERPKVDPAVFRAEGRYDMAFKSVTECEKICAEQARLRAEMEQLRSLMQSYTPYLDYERPLDFKGTASTVALLGALPGGTSSDKLLDALEGCAAVAQLIADDSTGLYISVLAHKDEEEQTRRALSAIGFLPASFADAEGTAKQLFDRADRRRAQIQATLDRLERRLMALSGGLTELEILSDIEHTSLLAAQHGEQLYATETCAVLCAWCPEQEKKRVIRALEQCGAAYDFAPPEEGEEAPILLRNNAFARNFEWVVGMYSYPAYGKFDPTFVMSIFYMLIFGLMFADAGYGLVLSAACFALVRYTHPREGMKRFLLMFGYCGLSCIVFGILFGSYFGNFPLAFLENVVGLTPDRMPRLSILPSEAANVAVLLDPIQNPLAFLIISLGVGAVHLLAGMGVQAYILCRRGKILDALFDIGSYYLLFAGIGVVFMDRTVGMILLLSGVAAILATQGRKAPSVSGKIIGGFGGLYNLINFASDLLSYSRILALGLASAVVGQVVNILATLKGASFIGILLMLVVFCIGHLLNLVINVLGTFVHTARLQYIEFFGKFYEDGGTVFRPIAGADRYSEDVTPEDIPQGVNS